MPTLLAFIAHPDDETYGFAGLMALAADAGWRCLVVAASSGERGKRHDGGPGGAASVGLAREAELAASCALLGAEVFATWRLPDGRLRDVPDLAARVHAAIEAAAPDLVFSLGEDGAYGHPDHIALFHAVAGACSGAGAPPLLLASFPRGLFLPQYELCIGMMGDPPFPPREAIGDAAAPYTLDIRPVADRKLAAISAHRTQLPGGDPEALFPPGIVRALLAEERFTDASGAAQTEVSVLLETFAAATSG